MSLPRQKTGRPKPANRKLTESQSPNRKLSRLVTIGEASSRREGKAPGGGTVPVDFARRSMSIDLPSIKEAQQLVQLEQMRMEEAQMEEVKKFFDFQCENACEFSIDFPTDTFEWFNVPALAIRLIVSLCKQGQTTAEHLKELSLQETAASLRQFSESELAITKQLLSDHCAAYKEQVSELEGQDRRTQETLQTLQNEFQSDRQLQTVDLAQQSLCDALEGVQSTQLLSDVAEAGAQDRFTPLMSNQARMFTLEQMNQLFNLLLRSSNVRKRLDTNDVVTEELRKKVENFELWRNEHETDFYNTKIEYEKRHDDAESAHGKLRQTVFAEKNEL